ncbi:hypothetical protein N665_0126s0068 [Sinapis alba]|nr:hypothetical protein N665_0126s0068 [Sinapis alba]
MKAMSLITNKVDRDDLQPGYHIYTYRAVFAYSHHGVFVGGCKVVHFKPGESLKAPTLSSSSSASVSENGSLYRFQYGVSSSMFVTRVRGGTCTTAPSDPFQTVVHRAMHLLQNGFGNYDIFHNNCKDFALYCKTGLLILDKNGVGRSGQASSILGAPLAALHSSPLTLLIPNPVGVATVTAGMYCMNRYATDIGVRTDVIKVPVEDLALNLGIKTLKKR